MSYGSIYHAIIEKCFAYLGTQYKLLTKIPKAELQTSEFSAAHIVEEVIELLNIKNTINLNYALKEGDVICVNEIPWLLTTKQEGILLATNDLLMYPLLKYPEFIIIRIPELKDFLP